MLVSLHVKNFAIINEVEVIFKDHLNILTGETGAGKSIIIGSINAALGAKLPKDIIRQGADYALVELVFETKEESVFELLREMDISIEDNQIILTRKIMPGRSICKINGENVTGAILSKIAGSLIDIHGQHEHQSLLQKAKHLEIVDRFSRDEIGDLKKEIEDSYNHYMELRREYDGAGIDEEKRIREMSFLEYEISEIQNAKLREGEDEELALLFKKLSNSNAILDGLQAVHRYTGYDTDAAGDSIGRALRQLIKIVEFDEEMRSFLDQITDMETMMDDFNRNLSQYLAGMENNEEELSEVSKRLDVINHLKQKYGNSIEDMHNHLAVCNAKLAKYQDYDQYLERLKNDLSIAEVDLEAKSLRLSEIRKQKSGELCIRIKEALMALNFLEVRFDMTFERNQNYGPNGFDNAEFIISTNPGEALKPLSRVASGGELSRVMLGIKSVLADKDAIESLIFDEIDVGISGRTAQKVSEQLSSIARHHQIICITHLAQIAAMADQHFIIEKQTDDSSTETIIREMSENEQIEELARILGGAVITDRVIENAKEMKELASASKNYL